MSNPVGSFLLIAVVLTVAAMLEVGGDAMIRVGLHGRSGWQVTLGAATLAGYGLVVNLIPWDLSRLLGTYVVSFATVAVLVGRFGFGDPVPWTTWLGLALIMLGGAVIQYGAR